MSHTQRGFLVLCLLFTLLIMPTTSWSQQPAAAGAGTAGAEVAKKSATDAALTQTEAFLKTWVCTVRPPSTLEVAAEVTTKVQAIAARVLVCDGKKKTADTMCMTNVSPHIQKGAAIVSAFIPMLQMTQGTSDACESYSGTMKAVSTALMAYNAACSATQMMCKSTCAEVLAELNTVAANAKIVCGNAETLASSITGITTVVNHCKDYAMNLLAAGAGLMSTMQQSSLAKQCKKLLAANQSCEDNPDQIKCPKKLDCTKQEYYNHAQCICQRNPTQQGCAGAFSNMELQYQQNFAGGENQDPSTKDVDFKGLGIGGSEGLDITPTEGGNSAAFGGVGGVGAGGGSGAGSGGGGSANNKKGSDGVAKIPNTNILGGFEGGGGGGRGFGGGSRGSDDSSYKAYMPGGKNDPTRNVASQKSLAAQGPLTGSGGKSNFEKVKERYFEFTPQLLGD